MLNIPSNPIGRIPRPPALLGGIAATGGTDAPASDRLHGHAIRDTIEPFEAAAAPVIALAPSHRPVRPAVISPPPLSLMYPFGPVAGYSGPQFIQSGERLQAN
jgi:hypothetical protein